MRARVFPHRRLVRSLLLLPLLLCTLAASFDQDLEITKTRLRLPAQDQAKERFEQGGVRARYLRLLDGYRAYDEAQAHELGTFWEGLYRDPLVLDMLVAAIPIDLAPLSEMALTDLALAEFNRSNKQLAEEHLRMAERLIALNLRPPVAQRDSVSMPRHTRFARDWYLALIWLRFARLDYDNLYVILDRARVKFPDDPEILLSSGTDAEIAILRERAQHGDDRGPAPTSAAHKIDTMKRVARAIDFFHRAIAIDPNAAEARIRLARVLSSLHERDHSDEALALLNEARAITSTPPLSYLAALFAGDIEEQRKNPEAASHWYRTAISECPRAQTARLAQSHVQLDLKGGLRGAANTLRPLPSAPLKEDGVCEPDPWRLYAFGQAWRLPEHVNRMRTEVREMTPVVSSQP